jgi:molybdopterin-guanine dinucleotide biosynthesis protein A
MDAIKVLILAGGHSTRMGSPKHLLPLADGPLYLHLVRTTHDALPNVKTHHISLAGRSQTDKTLDRGLVQASSENGTATDDIELKIIADDYPQDIGPAAGLLAAHKHDPLSTWLIIACDYALLEADAITQLVQGYEEPATCFRNEEGFSEPLLGIWSPQSLKVLEENVGKGRRGPNFTLKSLNGKLLVPVQEEWLTNVNTKQEWEAAKRRIQDRHSISGL